MLIVNTGGPLHQFRKYVTEPERQGAERPHYRMHIASDSDKPRLARQQDVNTTSYIDEKEDCQFDDCKHPKIAKQYQPVFVELLQ